MESHAHLRIAIIGAGMSGILAAIKLRESGLDDLVILEKAATLGGTWRDNTYPGLSCDVPSHLYTYTFEPNPEWSHLFSPGDEIQRYFAQVARKHGIEELIRYNREVVSARFDRGRWVIIAKDGSTETADIVIAATGVLHHPVLPDIEGRESFAGAAFHSARWDHAVPLEGRRIGIIGTGSTAAQIVPALVDKVARLSLFQRTPQWILPLANPAYTEEEKAAFRADPALMAGIYDTWSRRFQNTFARAVIGDEAQLAKIADAVARNLEDNVHDPVLREQLRPAYKAACKRLIMSDTFYPAIQRPNARLVTAGIQRIEAAGVRTVDGELHALDVLVYATGFNAHLFMRPMAVTGEAGCLDEAWSAGPNAFRSVALPGFPNFFMLCGPNSPVGNFSLIQVSEMQLAYVMQLIDLIRSGRCRHVQPTARATAEFNSALRAAMKGTVWVSGCRSWYLDQHGNPATWPWTFDRFADDMRAPRLEEFELTA